MRMAKAIVLAVLFLVAASAHGQGILVLDGGTDCGEWIEARKQGRGGQLEHFLTGFLNGLALGTQKDFWRATAGQTSREAVLLWMDNYCKANPLDTVVTAASTLFYERVGASK